MSSDVLRLPLALHPLIVEAKRRMRQRRLLVVCAAVLVAGLVAGLTVELRSPATPAVNVAGLKPLVGTWGGHGRTLVVRPSGLGLARFRGYIHPPPYFTVAFKVTSVTRTGSTVLARFRVTHGSSAVHAPAGTLGSIRLLRGVVYWSTNNFHPATNFCSIKPGARWVCGA